MRDPLIPRHTRGVVGILLAAVVATATTVRAQDDPVEPGPVEPTPVDPLPFAIRLAGGVIVPFGDAANDDPDVGWVGAQGAGFGGRVGIRIPFMETAYFRPEVSYQRYGAHDGTIDVFVSDGFSVTRERAAHHIESGMAAFRLYLEYIPLAGTGLDVFLAGGVGLAHVDYDRTLTLAGADPFTREEGELSGSLAFEVGMRIRGLELTASADFQSPRYEDGTPTWNTAHLYLAYLLPLP